MIEAEVIVVGGGPAGSTCARQLRLGGKEVIILDKHKFPRSKLCAGWITPKVIKDLAIDLSTYPHSLVTLDSINYHIRGINLTLRTTQYSIRRIEFDHWLLDRAGVPVFQHAARHLRYENNHFLVDDAYRCKYLIGAGGTNCPVYHTFFKELNPRSRAQQVVCLEQEFTYEIGDDSCHLWFFDSGLAGYSWYVPKGNGVLNVGIGGRLAGMKSRGETIHHHWDRFSAKLDRLSLVDDYDFHPQGYQYYLRSGVATVQNGNAYIIGDAAGLATKDIGEGIGPAIESALLVANAILTGTHCSIQKTNKYSLPAPIFYLFATTFRLFPSLLFTD